MLDRRLESMGLHHLRKIGKASETLYRTRVIVGISRQQHITSNMALMEPQNIATDLAVFGSGEAMDSGNIRHRLHSILRVEPPNKLFILLDRGSPSPNSPEVDVP